MRHGQTCPSTRVSDKSAEFSGTLLGFDDFVSRYSRLLPIEMALANADSDMVLEDVTEQYVFFPDFPVGKCI